MRFVALQPLTDISFVHLLSAICVKNVKSFVYMLTFHRVEKFNNQYRYQVLPRSVTEAAGGARGAVCPGPGSVAGCR